MAWLVLVIAGLFEVMWAIGLPTPQGARRSLIHSAPLRE